MPLQIHVVLQVLCGVTITCTHKQKSPEEAHGGEASCIHMATM